MNDTHKHIVKSYAEMLEGLSSTSKIELIENLSKSLKSEKKKKAADFYKSFGTFGSIKPAEEISAYIKESRKFRNKEIRL